MEMRGSWLLLTWLLVSISAFPQDGPKPFEPLNLGAPRGGKNLPLTNSARDPASIYATRHEAAIAALKAANLAAAAHQNDRAINLLLIATKRDPVFATVLYDLGVLCERTYRWNDAISFFKQVPFAESSPELKKLSGEELSRVQLIASFEATPEGKRHMEFDTALVSALSMRKDPAVGVDAASRLCQRDPSRWEAPAVVGLLSADLERWSDSLAALEAAIRLAPPERRAQLTNAREIARRQAHYQTVLGDADQAWEKQEYGKAAKLYAEAWEISPSATANGMQAADGYLLDDQVVPAVECLSRLRQIGSDDESQKATAMLEKLGAISDRARETSVSARTAKLADSGENPVAILARSLENVASPEMLLVARPAPETLQDLTPFIALNDEELTAPESAFLSTESIFAQYQKIAPPVAPPSPDDKTPDAPAPGTSAITPPASVSSTPQPSKPLPPGPVLPNLEPHP